MNGMGFGLSDVFKVTTSLYSALCNHELEIGVNQGFKHP
jgi:hypothetical protein